jgi:hypothetical protein
MAVRVNGTSRLTTGEDDAGLARPPYSQDELERMNWRFTRTVERAFAAGLESRAAAARSIPTNGHRSSLAA